MQERPRSTTDSYYNRYWVRQAKLSWVGVRWTLFVYQALVICFFGEYYMPDGPEQYVQVGYTPVGPAQYVQVGYTPDGPEQYVQVWYMPDGPEQYVQVGYTLDGP